MRLTIERKIAKANDLSQKIDAAEQQPKDLLFQFNKICIELRSKHRIDLITHVRCPANW